MTRASLNTQEIREEGLEYFIRLDTACKHRASLHPVQRCNLSSESIMMVKCSCDRRSNKKSWSHLEKKEQTKPYTILKYKCTIQYTLLLRQLPDQRCWPGIATHFRIRPHTPSTLFFHLLSNHDNTHPEKEILP